MEKVKEIFEKLSPQNKAILLKVAKGMQVAQSNKK